MDARETGQGDVMGIKKMVTLGVCMVLVVHVAINPAQSFAQRSKVATKADIKEAERIAEEAAVDFKAGRFDVAAQKYFAAYNMSHHPNMLYNAGRAKQGAKRWAEARELFVMYLDQPGVNIEGIVQANRRIAECVSEIAKTEAKPVEPAKPMPDVHGPTVSVDVTRTTDDDGDARSVGSSLEFDASKLVSWQSGTAIGFVALGTGLMVRGVQLSVEANTMPFKTDDEKIAYHSAYNFARANWISGLACEIVGVGFGYWAMTKAVSFGSRRGVRGVTVVPIGMGVALVGEF